MPSAWVTTHTSRPASVRNQALDLACGKGRHSFWLADQGWHVTAIDRDLPGTDQDTKAPITWIEADLERGNWPFDAAQFDLIVVVNYLHRPLFDNLRQTLRPGGTLIYETFMVGNEQYGRPRSPEFLLQRDELATVFADWHIIAQMQGEIFAPAAQKSHAVKQCIVARKP